MGKAHIKRLAAPKTWPINKKKEKFIIRPNPGPHSFKTDIPLNIILKNLIKNIKTSKEGKYLLTHKEIFVNNKIRRNPKLLVGFMDTISIPLTEKFYRVSINKSGKICLIPIKENESKIKLCKIKSKKIIKKGMVQLNFSNGENMLVNKKDYGVNDVVVINSVDNKISNLLKFKKGSLVYINKGKKVGEIGKIEDIKGKEIIIKLKNKKIIKTLKDYVFVIGEDKPIITLNEK